VRWVGSIFVWLGAPLAGVAAVNLPFLAYFFVTGRFGPVAMSHQGAALGAAGLLVIWIAALWIVARAHAAGARAVHLGVAGVLALAGAAATFLPALTGPNRAEVQQVI
jgi:hypothetical protein